MAQRPPDFSSDHAEEPSASGSRYLAAWAIMACCAALYLAVVSIRPAFLDGVLPAADGGSAGAAAQTAADIVNIRDSVGQLQSDVARNQADIAQQGEAARGLSERIAALEQKDHQAAAEPAARAAEPQRTGAVQPNNAAEGNAFPDSGHMFDQPAPARVAEAKPAKAAPAAKVLNAPIETGSVGDDAMAAPAPAAKAKPPAEKVAVAAPAEPKSKKPVGIKLATGTSVDNLRVSWGILSERHKDELAPLQPRYFNTVDGNGITFELVAGPFKTTADAKKVCQSLKAQAIDCQVSTFGGNSL